MIRALALCLWLIPTGAQAYCLCVKCLTGAFAHFTIPSEAMAPMLDTGTCLTLRRVLPGHLPKAGEVIGFDHPAQAGVTHLFRVIGLPGDTVQMMQGRVVLNGVPLPQTPAPGFPRLMRAGPMGTMPRCPTPTALGQTCAVARATETLPNGVQYQVLNVQEDSFGDTADPVTVPEGRVFVLGDHRDNALDSRFSVASGGPGLIPLANITGVFDAILQPPP